MVFLNSTAFAAGKAQKKLDRRSRNRREYLRNYQREWMRRRREAFFAGKTCKQCGCPDRLEIHHRDPQHKVSHRIWSYSDHKRKAELAKCDVLCYDCHLFISRATYQPRKANSTGFRGVKFAAHKPLSKPFKADISISGKTTSLGYYATAEDAARAYDRKAVELYGPLAVTNFPQAEVSQAA